MLGFEKRYPRSMRVYPHEVNTGQYGHIFVYLRASDVQTLSYIRHQISSVFVSLRVRAGSPDAFKSNDLNIF